MLHIRGMVWVGSAPYAQPFAEARLPSAHVVPSLAVSADKLCYSMMAAIFNNGCWASACWSRLHGAWCAARIPDLGCPIVSYSLMSIGRPLHLWLCRCEALAAMGMKASTSKPQAQACSFLLQHQREDGGWGESYLSCQDKVGFTPDMALLNSASYFSNTDHS